MSRKTPPQNAQDHSTLLISKDMGQMLNGLPKPIQNWLIKAIPEGATLTDMLRAIITDAYNEETQI